MGNDKKIMMMESVENIKKQSGSSEEMKVILVGY